MRQKISKLSRSRCWLSAKRQALCITLGQNFPVCRYYIFKLKHSVFLFRAFVQHRVGSPCHNFITCFALIRALCCEQM